MALRFTFSSPTIFSMALTKRQKQVVDFIAKFVEDNGYSRSRSLEMGPKYVQEHRRQRELEVPLLGKIAAGKPVEAVEQRATLSFADFVGHRDTYALEVSGDSMIEDHICDGDMILLERTSEV